jgi:hypothetical protein
MPDASQQAGFNACSVPYVQLFRADAGKRATVTLKHATLSEAMQR